MFLVESPTWVEKTRRTVYASSASPRKQDVLAIPLEATWFQKIWGPSQDHCLQNTADSDRFTPWIWKLSMFVSKQVSLWPSSMSSAGNEPNQHNPKIHHEPPWIVGRIDHQNMHIGTLWARSRLRRWQAPRCIGTSCLVWLMGDRLCDVKDGASDGFTKLVKLAFAFPMVIYFSIFFEHHSIHFQLQIPSSAKSVSSFLRSRPVAKHRIIKPLPHKFYEKQSCRKGTCPEGLPATGDHWHDPKSS